MTTTEWAAAEGILETEDGQRLPARAELTLRGLSLRAMDGEEIALWRAGDLVQTAEHGAILLRRRRHPGGFAVAADGNTDFILALKAIPDADAPMVPKAVVWTMAGIVAISLLGLVVFAWLFFVVAEWLFGFAG